jgi:DNA (cytosine-5)-methyltransferase 1
MIKAIDFFSGAGGLTRGLLDAGIKVKAGVDFDTSLQQTYEHNNKPSRFVSKDIKTINIHELRKELGITKRDVVMYAACSPCQPFSTLNSNRAKNPDGTKQQDERRSLLLDFAELVRQAPPDFIVVENVPGLGNIGGKEVFEKFLTILQECGFPLEHMVMGKHDACYYGVPQTRKRFILLASRRGPMQHPLQDAVATKLRGHLERFPKLSHGGSDEKYPNHIVKPLIDKHQIIVAAIPKDGGSRRDVKDTSILLKCHQDNPTVHKDVFGRMAWDKPAPTLTCRCADVYCGRFIHPEQDRGLSMREAAAIQTFPDDYKFFGSVAQVARQIGNAVPVAFAKRIGEALLASLPTQPA